MTCTLSRENGRKLLNNHITLRLRTVKRCHYIAVTLQASSRNDEDTPLHLYLAHLNAPLLLTVLVLSSPHIPQQVFAFDRTISRLLEMQSESYLAASTVRYPVESGGTAWLQRHLEQVDSSSVGDFLHRI